MKLYALIPLAFILFYLLPGCNQPDKKTDTTVNTDRPDSNTVTKKDAAVNPYAQVDISPMDMSYFPADYPKLKMTHNVSVPPLARLIYSRPHLEGRKLFHDVLKYNEPWRLGANEATELQLFRDATIQNKKIKAGRYVLYCRPQPDKWTIIFNSNIDSWGLTPDSTRDVAQFDIPVKTIPRSLEYFTMVFEKTDNGADLLMSWDNLEARLPIAF